MRSIKPIAVAVALSIPSIHAFAQAGVLENAMKILDILVKDAVILDGGVRSKREVRAEMAGALA